VYYCSEVYIDGRFVTRHFGGSDSFSVDITGFVTAGSTHTLVVNATSDLRSKRQTAGKQSLRAGNFECMYTRTTGIWQTVWMEAVARRGLARVRTTTDIDRSAVSFQTWFRKPSAVSLNIMVYDGAKVVARQSGPAADGSVFTLPIKKAKLWSPSAPFLYDVVFEVLDAEGKVVDKVKSYFGMRKIHIDGNRIYLNNEPFYQRLVLDQGFYPDGIWTAPSDEALRRDIELSMAAGFNGARLHQKVFEERFHYWADKLGYITWGEAPSWGMNANDPEVARNFTSEWTEEIVRDRNHPSIVIWTPMNEEWWPDRVQFPRFVSDLYDLTKQLDPTRPFHDVSGGAHVKTDIWSTHNYEQDPKRLQEIIYSNGKWFQAPHDPIDIYRTNTGFNRPTDVNRYDYPLYTEPTMPYILDEFGGIKWVKGQDKATGNSNASWGYGEPPHSLEEFYARLEGQVDALMNISDQVWGYCFTQLTDVEQEQNGVYFYDRTSKFDMNRIKAIFSKTPKK
jgi:beta-galactosidase/beta-glucuronidase